MKRIRVWMMMSVVAAIAVAMAGVQTVRGIREERQAVRDLEKARIYYVTGNFSADRFERASENLARLRAAHAFTRSGRLAAYREHIDHLREIVKHECNPGFSHPGQSDSVDCLEYREKFSKAERRLAALVLGKDQPDD